MFFKCNYFCMKFMFIIFFGLARSVFARYIDSGERSEESRNAENLWDLMIHKRRLQIQGVYPVVYMCNGKLVKLYVNQRTDLSDLCERLRQQQQPRERLQLVEPNRRAIHSKIMPIIKETYIKRSNLNQLPSVKILSSNTDKVQATVKSEKPKQMKATELNRTVSLMSADADETSKLIIVKKGEDLKKDAEVQQPFVYRRLSALNNEFTVPFENFEKVLKLSTQLSNERSLNKKITLEPNDNIELTTTITKTTNGMFETSEQVPRQSTDKKTSTSAPITTISWTTNSMDNELTTTATEKDVKITPRHINILNSVESTHSSDEDMTPIDESESFNSNIMTSTSESNPDEMTTETIDFDEITSTLESITQTIDVDDTTLTTESHENGMSITGKYTDDLNNSMDYVADASDISVENHQKDVNRNRKSYFSDELQFDTFHDEYNLDQLILDEMYRLKLKQLSATEKQVLRSLFRSNWKNIRKEVNDLKNIINDEDPVLMDIFNTT